MELLAASAIGVLVACAVWLMLRTRTFDVILGLTLLSYAVNAMLFMMGGLALGKPPLIREGLSPTLASYADPVPQALVLTAIVISFAMTALLVVVALRSREDNRSDHVDGDDGDGR
jgi:multicomponent K+:H+ antiporter subunit C